LESTVDQCATNCARDFGIGNRQQHHAISAPP
jgi:hypothetical protein